jgi:hypothetical protein
MLLFARMNRKRFPLRKQRFTHLVAWPQLSEY